MWEVKHKDFGEALLLRMSGNSPILRILDISLENRYFDFSKSEVIRELGVGKQAFCNYFENLEDPGIAKPTERIGKTTPFRIDEEHPLVRTLNEHE